MRYQDERNYACRLSDEWVFRGLKTVVMENEFLRVIVLADKGADIYQFVYKPLDVDFLWKSPWGVTNPSTYIPTTGDGVGIWMDTYEGGWQTVLPAGGFSSQHEGADMGLHGEVNTIPWDCLILQNDANCVSVKFSVRAYRTPFFFEKTLTLETGSSHLKIEQRLVNEGGESVHCVWGEHIALGAPFLSDKCVIDLPGGTIINHPVTFHENNRLKLGHRSSWPHTQLKDESNHDLSLVPGKDFRSYDQSYITDMPQGWYGITNQEIGVGFGVSYSKDLYQYLWYWQSLGGGTGYPWYGRTYNIGLEPFTSYTNEGLGNAVENGTALLLKPGEEITTTLLAIAFESDTGVDNILDDGTVELKF